MPREPHTEVRQTPCGDDTVTTVHHLNDDGEESSIEVSGAFPRIDLQLEESVRGHEMVLPQRASKVCVVCNEPWALGHKCKPTPARRVKA